MILAARFVAIPLLLIFLSACSTTSVTVSPETTSLPAAATLLPLSTTVEITREHAGAVEQAILSSLRNRGFLVSHHTDNSPVRGAVIKAHIDTFRRDSILAGHVNILGGSLSYRGAKQQLLAKSEHTESERGGLLFNSGQLLKGLTDEIDNLQDKKFDSWVKRYAEALVRALPEPKIAASDASPTAPSIERISLTERRAGIEICAFGTPGSQARVLFTGDTAPLIEAGETGRYCLTLPSYIDRKSLQGAKVEISNAFGLRAVQAVPDTQNLMPCPQATLLARLVGSTLTFAPSCSAAKVLTSCADIASCQRNRFRTYRLGSGGTFSQLAEFGIRGGTTQVSDVSNFLTSGIRAFVMSSSRSIQRPIPVQVTVQDSK
jgi:hypothetical protein